ncbi:MAG: copper resistance CopC family protein, partial [Cellulomonas sp.]
TSARRRPRRRAVRRVALLLTTAALLALAGPAPLAQAHAFLAGSNPADGQVLDAAPHELHLQFSESVVLGATQIDIVDSHGRHYAPGDLSVVGDGADTEAPVEIVGTLPALDSGAYRVSWETLSSDDLHRTSGVLVFGIGETVTAGGLVEPSPRPLEAGLRWVMFLGLSGALGGALASRLLGAARAPVAASPPAVRDARRATRVSLGGAATGVMASVVLLADQLSAVAGPGDLLRGSYGLRWGLREVGLLLLVAAAATRLTTRAPSGRGWLLATGAALALVGNALLGHSGAGATTSITRVLASAAHLGAAATWAGCLVVLAVVLLPHARPGSRGGRRARTVLRLFGPPAAACVGVMVVTGVYLASEVIGSVDAALFTVYGRTLLLKLALACVAGILALVNTFRLHRSRPRRTPRATVAAEALAAVGVLALAAVLTSAQPAMEPELVRSTVAATDSHLDRVVADLQESVAIQPNLPGPNVLLVDLYNTRRPAPAPVRSVEIVLTPVGGTPQTFVAEALVDDQWSIHADLAAPGRLAVEVIVHRAGLDDTSAVYSWVVGGAPDRTRAAVVSTDPIGPALRIAALVLLIVLLVVWFLVPIGTVPIDTGAGRSRSARTRSHRNRRDPDAADGVDGGVADDERGDGARRDGASGDGANADEEARTRLLAGG